MFKSAMRLTNMVIKKNRNWPWSVSPVICCRLLKKGFVATFEGSMAASMRGQIPATPVNSSKALSNIMTPTKTASLRQEAGSTWFTFLIASIRLNAPWPKARLCPGLSADRAGSEESPKQKTEG